MTRAPERIRTAQPKEWQLHGYVADLLRFTARRGVLWMHIPNEGQRAPRTGAFLKRLGMMPGAADFLIVIPPGKAHWLEIKTAKGRQTAEQRAFADWAFASGCPYEIIRSPEEAQKVLASWGVPVISAYSAHYPASSLSPARRVA